MSKKDPQPTTDEPLPLFKIDCPTDIYWQI